MKLEFVGVGEAFDFKLGSHCLLIHSQTSLLVDCGWAALAALFEQHPQPDFVDAVYITHFHADHTFGIPAMLARMIEERRTKPLTFIGQAGTQKRVSQIVSLAYGGLTDRCPFEILFLETEKSTSFKEFQLSFAETAHSMKNMALCIESNGVSVGISGDGGLTDSTRQLFRDCTVLIHEAYTLNDPVPGHTTAEQVVAFARSCPKLKTLALVHLKRDERKTRLSSYQALGEDTPFSLAVPQPGEVMEVNP